MEELTGTVSIDAKLSGKVTQDAGLSGNIAITGLTNTIETYNWPAPTGQTTEYAEFDDAWQYFNIWKPVFEAEAGKKRIVPRLLDFFTLVDNNAFGNLNRFTDEKGLQNYNNDYVVDNYTGLGWYRYPYTRIYLLLDAIAEASSLNVIGFNDFYIPNILILSSINRNNIPHTDGGILRYSPFNLRPTNSPKRANFHTSTISQNTPSVERNMLLINNNNPGYWITNPSIEQGFIPYRKHF